MFVTFGPALLYISTAALFGDILSPDAQDAVSSSSQREYKTAEEKKNRKLLSGWFKRRRDWPQGRQRLAAVDQD